MPAKGERRIFSGPLRCHKGDVLIRLEISDWNFLRYPSITILDRPVFLPHLAPHVNVLGGLCYFRHGAVTLDRYDPARAIIQCLDQATAVLDRIVEDSDYRRGDILNEFLYVWEFGQLKMPMPVFLGNILPTAKSASYFGMDAAGEKRYLIATDAFEAGRFAKAFGSSDAFQSRCECWIFRTTVYPYVPEVMPQTIKDLFAWLKLWNADLAASLQKVLAEPAYLDAGIASFAIDTPVGWIGFVFDLDESKRKAFRRRPKEYRHFLHNEGGKQSLMRLSIEQVGSEFVHSRNLNIPDLGAKRITVIGCGAIGSFVGQAMVRLGAGTGKGGLLKLIDPDYLAPENLGRHALGYPDLLKPKAQAMAQELKRQFPHSNVQALSKSAFDDSALFDADLIIDATGEETVSEFLNGLALMRDSRPPTLYVWVVGNGEAVQALWVDGLRHACYRCLLVPSPNEHRKERLTLLKKPPHYRHLGCRAFTPYAVSAPMHAAALATDLVCSWMNGDPSPRFRSRSLENADVYKVKSQDLSRIAGCAACSNL